MAGHGTIRQLFLESQPRNRRLTEIVAAGYAALCLAFCKPLPRLSLLMWGEGGLAPEFDALGFRIGPAPRRALGDAAAGRSRRATHPMPNVAPEPVVGVQPGRADLALSA
jgi:hypothetical protein